MTVQPQGVAGRADRPVGFGLYSPHVARERTRAEFDALFGPGPCCPECYAPRKRAR